MVPLVAGSVPASTASNVDFPAPLGPVRWRPASAILAHGGALEHAPRLGANAVRPKPEKPDDQQADRHPLERWDEARRPQVGDAGAVVEEARDLFEADRHQQRAQDGAYVVAPTAHDDGGEQDDRFGVKPNGRRPHLDEADQDGAREPGDQTADYENRHLQLHRVLADGGRRELALTHRAQAPAVW